ncbi:unnamed protein product [Prunus brigantina]
MRLLFEKAAVHAKAEYFNSKRGPTTPALNPFASPSPASAPTPAPPQHSTPAPSTQDAQHPKRKDSYQHTFNNNKRGRHNHHQSPSHPSLGLIREGKLDKYVHNMISTISGGPTLAGTSNNSIKHYVRSTYAH